MEGRPGQGLFLAMANRVRIVRTADGAVLGGEVFRYRSEAHPYERWTDKDAALFRTAVEAGFQHAAERIARSLGGERIQAGAAGRR
jgi:hypothetical protein